MINYNKQPPQVYRRRHNSMFWGLLPFMVISMHIMLGLMIVPLAIAEDSSVTENVTDDTANDSVIEEVEGSYGSGPFEGMSLMPLACVN